jgi:hypothetical protein
LIEIRILREHEVDFIVKTEEKTCLVETKADKGLDDPTLILKAKATRASKVSPPKDMHTQEYGNILFYLKDYSKQTLG